MKKLFVTILLAALVATASDAQYFVGGSLGLTSHSSKTETDGSATTKSPSAFGLSISPKVGYYLNDKLAVGISAGFAYKDSTYYTNTTLANKTIKTYTWSVSPFARYTFLQFGKFSVLAEATVGINGSSSTYKQTSSNDGPSTFGCGINVVPILSYNFTPKFSLETNLNFMSLGFNYLNTKTPEEYSGSAETHVKTTTFGLGVNSNSMVTVGNITIGAIYKF